MAARHCAHCGDQLPERGGRGRPPRFCCAAHRSAAQLRRDQGLPENAPAVRPGGRRRLADRLADRLESAA